MPYPRTQALVTMGLPSSFKGLTCLSEDGAVGTDSRLIGVNLSLSGPQKVLDKCRLSSLQSRSPLMACDQWVDSTISFLTWGNKVSGRLGDLPRVTQPPGSRVSSPAAEGRLCVHGLPRKSPLGGNRVRMYGGSQAGPCLTCKVRELSGPCWLSEQSSGRTRVAGSSGGAGSGGAGSDSGLVGCSLSLHSFILTTKSQHV